MLHGLRRVILVVFWNRVGTSAVQLVKPRVKLERSELRDVIDWVGTCTAHKVCQLYVNKLPLTFLFQVKLILDLLCRFSGGSLAQVCDRFDELDTWLYLHVLRAG